ncbi:MAG: hypothetical protein FJ290_08330 [Planctomycetes bacterium]|nr:hypothetical protein [Planctomycetota bacterium]
MLRMLPRTSLAIALVPCSLSLQSCSQERVEPPPAMTPARRLLEAIRQLDLDAIRRLVPSELSPNAVVGDGTNPTGDTPLGVALWLANQWNPDARAYDVIEYLIQCGADVNARDKDGRTALHFPHNKRVVQLLLASGAEVDLPATEDGTTPLYRTRDLGMLTLLVPHAKNINSLDKHGMTALDYHLQWADPGDKRVLLLRSHGAKTASELGVPK